MVAIVLAAPNTPSGSPQRCVLIVDTRDIKDAIDCGYLSPHQAMRDAGYSGYPLGDWIKVSASEYKAKLKQYKRES
jgi:hypothetical protein